MSRFQQKGPSTEAAVLQSMVLLSTLTTAAEVRHAVEERRAGRDPSAQEAPAVVQPYLCAAASELMEMLLRLRASLVYARHHDEGTAGALVRRFDDLMTLHRVAGLLRGIHQRLLSLYPGVGEALVEEARLLHGACHPTMEQEDLAFLNALGPFLERALVFSARLQDELPFQPT